MTPQDLLRDMHDQPEWYRDAVCAQTDPDAFYPDRGGSNRDAKRICLSCPVREQCLTYALDNDEEFGVWGGTSFAERSRMKRGVVVPIQTRRQLSPEARSRILELLCAPHLTLRGIAESMGVSEKTVRRVRDNQKGAA